MAPKRLSSKKEEQGYQIVYNDLKSSGIGDAEQAQERIAVMMADGRRYTVVATILLLIFLLLLPRYAVFAVMLYLIFMAWAWTSIMAGKRYINRYVEEEFADKEDADDSNPNDK